MMKKMTRELNDIKFVFDYKTPTDYLGFGYTRQEIPDIFELLNRERFELHLIIIYKKK